MAVAAAAAVKAVKAAVAAALARARRLVALQRKAEQEAAQEHRAAVLPAVLPGALARKEAALLLLGAAAGQLQAVVVKAAQLRARPRPLAMPVEDAAALAAAIRAEARSA